MTNAVVINSIGLSPYAYREKLPSGRTAFEHVLDYSRKLPEGGRTVCLTDSGDLNRFLKDGMEEIRKDEWDVCSLLRFMQEELKDFDNIFYFFGDAPLLDSGLTERMYQNHNRYFAQYTFAEGYPYGLAPEIIKTEIAGPLLHLCGEEREPIRRESVFTVLQKDINAFEIETILSPEDMRFLRLHLVCNSRRNIMLSRGIMEAGGMDAETVGAAVRGNPVLLRTLPAYYYVQISDRCPQACSYCPFPGMNEELLTSERFMAVEDFGGILEAASDFSGDAVIGIGLWGEPSLHPQIESIVGRVMEKPSLSLLIETSAVGWDRGMLKRIARLSQSGAVQSRTAAEARNGRMGASRISWITSLDSPEQNLYRRLRGDGFFEADETSRFLLELFPGNAWVQAVRMQDNEPELENFFKQWKATTQNVIIQKYDDFCGVLPERKVADLSPVNRFPCWHLKRDVVIRIDGTVTLCREDIGGRYVLGNILKEPIEEIWKRGAPYYEQHLSENYNPLCNVCDEYYTYNF